MAIGIFGSNSLSDVDFNDVDVLFSFAASREVIGDVEMKPLFSNVGDADLKKMFGVDGSYKLRLPANIFNQIGFYSILIKPKTIQTTLLDCSFVVTNNNNEIQISKRGIIIPALQFQKTSSLTGFLIEYFDKNTNTKIKNFKKIITSSDLVSISTNNNNVARGSTSYVLDPNGTSLFLTVTPDEGSLISNNSSVDIGSKGQTVLISNTFFDPVMIEVEMVNQTIKTLSYALYGNSTKDNELGIYTIFSDTNQIYKQYTLFSQKKQFSNGTIDARQEKSIINLNQDFNQTIQGLII